jgi:hypothetical protein
MITTGSKFLFGVGAYGIVAAIAYWLATDERSGLVVLAVLALAALFAGGVTVAIRDGAVATAAYRDGLPEDASTVGRGPLVSACMWPILGAFGIALLVLGLTFEQWMVWAGIVVLAATLVEWVVQSWSDRASDDGEYNRRLRNSVIQPIEFPVLGLAAAGLVVFGFSRVMLSVTTRAAVVAFILVAGLVLVIAALLSGVRRRIGGGVIVATLMVGGIIVLTAGVIGAIQGERGFHEHEGEGANTQTVADKSSLVADFVLDDGELSPTTIHVPRALPASITFTNHESDKRRFVLDLGAVLDEQGEPTEERQEVSTGFVEDGQQAFLSFRIDLPGTYGFHVEAEGGADRIEGTFEVS